MEQIKHLCLFLQTPVLLLLVMQNDINIYITDMKWRKSSERVRCLIYFYNRIVVNLYKKNQYQKWNRLNNTSKQHTLRHNLLLWIVRRSFHVISWKQNLLLQTTVFYNFYMIQFSSSTNTPLTHQIAQYSKLNDWTSKIISQNYVLLINY